MAMRIRRLVDEVDEQHREAMRTIHEDLAERHLGPRTEAVDASRRRFVRRLGVGGAVALGAAAVPMGALVSPAAAQTATATSIELSSGDLELLLFAQGLELALDAAYGLAVDTNKLTSPEAELCRTFGRHHTEHAAALATVAGKTNTVKEPNQKLLAALGPPINAATDAKAVLQAMYQVEQSAAATYLDALGHFDSWAVAEPAATILPIEAQHSVALGLLVGLPQADYLPAFETTTAAYSPAQYAS